MINLRTLTDAELCRLAYLDAKASPMLLELISRFDDITGAVACMYHDAESAVNSDKPAGALRLADTALDLAAEALSFAYDVMDRDPDIREDTRAFLDMSNAFDKAQSEFQEALDAARKEGTLETLRDDLSSLYEDLTV